MLKKKSELRQSHVQRTVVKRLVKWGLILKRDTITKLLIQLKKKQSCHIKIEGATVLQMLQGENTREDLSKFMDTVDT